MVGQESKAMLGQAKKFLSNYIFILGEVGKVSPAALATLAISTALQSVLPALGLILNKQLIDLLSSDLPTMSRVIMACAAIAANQISTIIIQGIATSVRSVAAMKIELSLKTLILRKVAELDLTHFDQGDFYVRLANADRGVGDNWEYLLSIPSTFVSSIVNIGTMSAILGAYRPLLLFIVLLGLVPNGLVEIWAVRVRQRFYADNVPIMRKLGYLQFLMTSPIAAKELKLFQTTNRYITAFRATKLEQNRQKQGMLLSTTIARSIAYIWASGILFLSAIWISSGVVSRAITIGAYTMLTGAVAGLNGQFAQVFQLYAATYEQSLLAKLLSDFLQIRPLIIPGQCKRLVKHGCPPRIELSHVTFRYPGATYDALTDVTLRIKPREHVAIVGENGAGKTTLVKIMMGLYAPTKGRASIGGIQMAEYIPEDLYLLFTALFQDYTKYNFTLREAIAASGNWNADETRIARICSRQNIRELVERLPNGLDTYLGKGFELDGVSSLSEGEWQRVAVARTFYRDAPIIVLDEPTACLDAFAEERFYQELVSLVEGKTAILISHRLATARSADRIIFLEAGRIVEEGSHEMLMSEGRRYRHLFHTQARRYGPTTSEGSTQKRAHARQQ